MMWCRIYYTLLVFECHVHTFILCEIQDKFKMSTYLDHLGQSVINLIVSQSTFGLGEVIYKSYELNALL